MGCCTSRESAHSTATRSPQVYDTSRGPSLSNDDSASLGASHQAHALRRPDAALRKPKQWRSTSRTWSRTQLAREREIFWETQVTGQREVWSALHLAVDMARDQNDLQGAKAVLDACGCTCPTGRMVEGVWDERGVLYKLPKWVISDPLNIAEVADDEDHRGHDLNDDVAEEVEDEEEHENIDDDNGEDVADGVQEKNSRNTKGKTRSSRALHIRARLSDRATDVEVSADPTASVKTVIKRVQAEANISTQTKIKLAYLGNILHENESLTAQGWQQGHVLNALVFQPSTRTPES